MVSTPIDICGGPFIAAGSPIRAGTAPKTGIMICRDMGACMLPVESGLSHENSSDDADVLVVLIGDEVLWQNDETSDRSLSLDLITVFARWDLQGWCPLLTSGT